MTVSDVVTTERIEATIAEIEEELGFLDAKWHALMEEETFTNWGLYIPVRALVAEDWLMTIYIGGDDGEAHGLELSHGTLVEILPEEDAGSNG